MYGCKIEYSNFFNIVKLEYWIAAGKIMERL